MHVSWEPAALAVETALATHTAFLGLGKGAIMSVDTLLIRALTVMNAARHACDQSQRL